MALLDRFAPVVTFEFGASSVGGYGITVEDMAEFWRGKPFAIFDILGRRLGTEELIESTVKQEVWDYVALPVPRAEPILREWNARR